MNICGQSVAYGVLQHSFQSFAALSIRGLYNPVHLHVRYNTSMGGIYSLTPLTSGFTLSLALKNRVYAEVLYIPHWKRSDNMVIIRL